MAQEFSVYSDTKRSHRRSVSVKQAFVAVHEISQGDRMRSEGLSVAPEDRDHQGESAEYRKGVDKPSEKPCWRVVTVDKSSKVFLEDELKEVLSLVVGVMKREVKIAEKHIKRMKS